MNTSSFGKLLCKLGIAGVLLVGSGCSNNKPETMESENVLLAEWVGPYGGVPAFDKIDLDQVKPALEKGMRLKLAEIDEIANNTEAPTFENTIEAMERAGDEMRRALTYYGILSNNISTPEFRDIRTEMAPRIAEFNSMISQNAKLFRRIKEVYAQSIRDPLPDDKQRVVQLVYENFAMNGAELDGKARDRYAEINRELSELYTSFSNNVLADEENYVIFLTEDQLGGLSDSFIKAAAKAAMDLGEEGMYAISNTRSVVEPFLTFSNERDMREKVWRAYKSRGDNDDEHDNKQIISKILTLRDEKVGLLGFENYASWRLQDRMAKTPQRAFELMNAIWPLAIERVKEEVAEMQSIADELGHQITIRPWDYLYYSEKVRKATYDLDSDEVKQYLQLDKLQEAMFFVAREVFSFDFELVSKGTVPVFHEDVEVWEVIDRQNAQHVGLWYLDPYARKGKRSGAWATTYRSHSTFNGKETVLGSNNSNFIKPAPGEPVLLSWSDSETLFHEFGHALHFLSSNVKYPTLNGGVRDYTEFQSQLLERWLLTDEVIKNYLIHHRTGEIIPTELVDKIRRTATFNQGYETVEYLSSAFVDMKYHTLDDPAGIDVEVFEKKVLEELNMPRELAMRHRSTHFSHIFSSESYAAGYYSYIWADVLTSDAAEMLAQAPGGFYDKELTEKLVKYLFAPRNSIDPVLAYKLFRGREADISELMKDRGFIFSK